MSSDTNEVCRPRQGDIFVGKKYQKNDLYSQDAPLSSKTNTSRLKSMYQLAVDLLFHD